MRKRLILVATALLAASMMVVLAAPAQGADPPTEWQEVATTPNADDGYVPVKVFTAEPGVVYVATTRSDPAGYQLFRWDGDWTMEIDRPGYVYSSVLFGTAPDDIWAAAYSTATPTDAVLFHFDGAAWAEEALPPSVAGQRITSIGGVPGEIQVGVGRQILRRTSTGWTTVYDAVGYLTVVAGTMYFVEADDAYVTSCWGHAWYDGVTWTAKVEFDFCDENDIWGARDEAGDLHLWVVGNNNFSSGVRIWKYDEAAHSFGSKYGFEFGDPPTHEGSRLGNANGIWGAAWDDVYVTGYRWTPEHPYPGTPEGRLYHNDGTGWTALTLPTDRVPTDVWGTGHDDVWFVFRDGALLHLGPTDADGDGVVDADDVCAGTVIPDPVIPEQRLGVNRWALTDGDGVFDTTHPKGASPDRTYTIHDTGGCNAEQIATALDLGNGHWKFGLSNSAIDDWITQLP
ncbi:MAG: hypothetical protein HKN44_00805 [Ilumatobacter sp.]|nr:hypothetical protein [Ilumatobacter sp.]